MSETLSRHYRTRAVRWLTYAVFCSEVISPWRAAYAQDENTPEEAAPAAAESEAASRSAEAEAEAEAALAEDEAEAMSEDEAESEAQLRRAPPKGKGVVWGSVKDTKFKEGVIDAQVQVVGRKEKTFADVNGGYRLELPPGKYNLRVSFELHRPSRVDAVEVKAGAVSRVDFELVPDETSIEEVIIEDEADLTSTEGQNLGRKRAAVVGDGVGRAEIARTPDRNAAEAAQRVVGATIVDGRFVFVRGLGERYTNALLNGSPLPSTEPDRNTVPLDLFPALVLDSLTIVKQFTPDMPADFAGGSVRVVTRDFPKQPLFQLSLSGAFNTQGTFRERPTYYGSSREWLGFDGGRRALPDLPNRRLDSATTTQEEQVLYGHRVNSPMGTQRETSPPNWGASLVAGNSYKLGTDSKLGAMVALTYGRSYQLRSLTARRFYMGELPDRSPTRLVGNEFYGKQGIDSVRWGAFGSIALEPSRNSTIKLIALRSQSADDQATELEGRYEQNPALYHTNHLEYVTRALNFVQLGGTHRFPKQGELEIEWHGSLAVADRDQPDTRDTRYRRDTRAGVEGWSFVPDSSGQHHYLTQSDTTVTGGLDVLKPIIRSEEHRTSFKVGALVTSRRREFRARRFQLIPAREPGAVYDALSFCPGANWDPGCPNRLFRREGVGPDGLLLDEWTLRFDQYETGLDVYSAYAMIDSKILEKLRAVAGVRGEITYQAFSGFDPFDRVGTEARSNIYNTNWLPALSMIYSASTKSNVRLGVSQTLARPQLRELSPALSTSFSGDAAVQGNPNLSLTKITNADLRFEYFPTMKEVLAVSVFYKRFKDPIEEIIAGTDLIGFSNAPKADLLGVELEGRKTLDVLVPALKDFTLIANLTAVKSEVDLGLKQLNATNAKRALSYQSPYVINLSLDYSNDASKFDLRVLYNVYGPRITVVGANGLPDTYELPRHQLDVSVAKTLAKHFQVKLLAQNVLGSPIVFAYRNADAYRLTTEADGSQVYESLGRTPTLKRWNPGATFSLTGTYTY
jgi:TonB-dependent receptor